MKRRIYKIIKVNTHLYTQSTFEGYQEICLENVIKYYTRLMELKTRSVLDDCLTILVRIKIYNRHS